MQMIQPAELHAHPSVGNAQTGSHIKLHLGKLMGFLLAERRLPDIVPAHFTTL